MDNVAVLFVRPDSIYKSMSGVDVYDANRDALSFYGDLPVVAHPPCRAWSRLRKFAKPRPGEKDLAIFAIEQVRKNGGVLEHPDKSSLWNYMGLPKPGSGLDVHGGFSTIVSQKWFGHKAEKKTLLYICGIMPFQVPPFPISLGAASHVCGQYSGSEKTRPELSKADRERTPPQFAQWLIELAMNCAPGLKAVI